MDGLRRRSADDCRRLERLAAMPNQQSAEFVTEDSETIKVTVIKFDAVTSLELLTKIGKPLIAAFGGSTVAVSMGELFAMLTPQTIVKHVEEILALTEVQRDDANGQPFKLSCAGGRKAISKAFGTDITTMLLAAKFALEVNYARFLAEMRAAGERKKAALEQSKEPVQTTEAVQSDST